MMIDRDKYSKLNIDDRANILWDKGVFISEIIEYGKYKVCIYELNHFFVGVYYNLKDNSIDNIEVLTTNKYELLKSINPN